MKCSWSWINHSLKLKNMWFRVVAMVVTHELIRVWSFNSHWQCSPFFIRLDILTNFIGNKNNCFLRKIFSTKPSLRLKSDRLTWWVFTVLLLHNNSFASKNFFGHWRCSPCFIRLEILINFVGNKNNLFFNWISCPESQVS